MSSDQPIVISNRTVEKIFLERKVLVPWLALVTALPGVSRVLSGDQPKNIYHSLLNITQTITRLANGQNARSLSMPCGMSKLVADSPQTAYDVVLALFICTQSYNRLTPKNPLLQDELAELVLFVNYLSRLFRVNPRPGVTISERWIELERRVHSLLGSEDLSLRDGPKLFWHLILEPEFTTLLDLQGESIDQIALLIHEALPWDKVRNAYTQARPGQKSHKKKR